MIQKILKYSAIVLLSMIGVLILLLAAVDIVIRSLDVQNLAEQYSKEYLNAEINADTVEIHLLRNFPYASLSVSDCRVRSLAFEQLDSSSRALVPATADSLARIGRLDISVSVVDLLSGKISIKGVELVSAEIRGYVSQFGINNWDILKDTTDTDSDDSTSLNINIGKISIDKGARISLCSVPDSANVDFSLRELLIRGKISSALNENYITRARLSGLVLSTDHFNKIIVDSLHDNSLKFSVDTLDVSKRRKSDMVSVDVRMRTDLKLHGAVLAKNVPFDMIGKIRLSDPDSGKLVVGLDDFTIYAATLPVTMNGSFSVSDDGVEIPGVKGRIDNYNLKNILAYIPEIFLDPGTIETDAAISLLADIRGKYKFETGELPVFDISMSIPSSTLTLINKNNGRKGRLNNIELYAGLHFDSENPNGNTLEISKFAVEGRSISLNLEAKVDEYTLDPLLELNVRSRVNLDTLSLLLPRNTDIIASGSLTGNFRLKGRAGELNMFSLSRNDIEGEIISDSLRLKLPETGIDFNCGKTALHAGILENSSDALLTKGKRIFNAGINLDTLYFNYKDSMMLSGSAIVFSASQEPSQMSVKQNKKRLSPLKLDGNLRAGDLSLLDADSSRVRLRGAESSFSIVPWTDGRTPVISFDAGLKAVSLAQSGSRFFAANSALSAKVVTHMPKRTVRDSVIVRDSLFNTRRFVRTVLRNWDIKGNMKSSMGRVITPSLPLRTRFSDFDLAVTNDGMHFQNTRLNIGNSSITLSGRLQGLAKAVTEHQKLTFTGSIYADSLDVDQLMYAYSNGQTIQLNDDRSDEAIEQAMQQTTMEDTSEMKAPVFPGFLDADLDLNLEKVTFQKNALKSLEGKLAVQNGIFLMRDFKIGTQSGTVNLNAFYAARKIEDVSVGFDMRMEKFEVADLIDFIPDVDTLFPMLKSFQGKITCTISAMSKMDSLLNMKTETINGIASIEGENVVLMDGETFSEIARMLKFKNRDRNLIDKISAQCVAADDKIEIFPFVVQMDRYKAAVSGTQNMDMSFNYHVSVLKSPVPFRIGLNISGTVDDMKFRIGKCLYKSENVPVYTETIDSARVNLGKQIRGVFLNGVSRTMENGNTGKLARAAVLEQDRTNDMETLSESEKQQLESTAADK